MSAPYDVPAAITALSNLLLTQGGQTAVLRLLGDAGITLEQLNQLWEAEQKALPPELVPESKP